MWVYALALLCLVWASGGDWEPPIDDAITFRPGGYACVEDNGDFDPKKDGLTIEAWILIDVGRNEKIAASAGDRPA